MVCCSGSLRWLHLIPTQVSRRRFVVENIGQRWCRLAAFPSRTVVPVTASRQFVTVTRKDSGCGPRPAHTIGPSCQFRSGRLGRIREPCSPDFRPDKSSDMPADLSSRRQECHQGASGWYGKITMHYPRSSPTRNVCGSSCGNSTPPSRRSALNAKNRAIRQRALGW